MMYPSTATGYMNILSYSIGLHHEDWTPLKERGIHVLEPIRRGWTVLYTAALHGCFDVCKEIIDNNPPLDYVHCWSHQGKYSNWTGSRHKGDGVYEWMIQSYSERESWEYIRISPLTAASEFGHIDICRLLIDYMLKYRDALSITRTGLRNSLNYSIKAGHDDIAVLLFTHYIDADPHAMTGYNRFFDVDHIEHIRHACIHGCIRTFSLMCERWHDTLDNPHIRQKLNRYTKSVHRQDLIRLMMYAAVESGQTDMCRFIISLGVDFDLEEALRLSIQNKHRDVCTLLTSMSTSI